ncbi:hypothetical protein IEQ34_010592 [Dendrobium chrysotoxum]|uniref:Uncharacterized protein n=1 Tax=Dendrobium chrysotoxum TaxID=161865 RepID=A0AAV7GDS2_DENCH|nr:hypothetical protein IEQ34_010592 [Dendrobium chrysotoxum]
MSVTSSGRIVRRRPTKDWQCLPNALRALAPIFLQELMSKKVMLESFPATCSTTASVISLLGSSRD